MHILKNISNIATLFSPLMRPMMIFLNTEELPKTVILFLECNEKGYKLYARLCHLI